MKGKKVTLSDIAKRLNISKSAVSMALNNSPEIPVRTRERVAKKAKAMGYVKNELVSSMMSSLKKSSYGGFSESIAIINGNKDEYALSNHPTLPKYFIGIKDEAKKLGYSINEFWLHDLRLTPEKLERALRARNIRGGVIIGHSSDSVLPSGYECIWRNFYFVSIGIKTYNPTLEMVSADQYAISYMAVQKALALGYKRPGLVLEERIDDLVGGRFIGGYLRAQMKLPQSFRLRPFSEADSSPGYVKRLYEWFDKNRPDAVLYLLDSTREILLRKKSFDASKTKLIQLERRGYVPEWVGIEQNNDLVGRVAMRRLRDALNRNERPGKDTYNMTTLVPPTWVEASLEKEGKI